MADPFQVWQQDCNSTDETKASSTWLPGASRANAPRPALIGDEPPPSRDYVSWDELRHLAAALDDAYDGTTWSIGPDCARMQISMYCRRGTSEIRGSVSQPMQRDRTISAIATEAERMFLALGSGLEIG